MNRAHGTENVSCYICWINKGHGWPQTFTILHTKQIQVWVASHSERVDTNPLQTEYRYPYPYPLTSPSYTHFNYYLITW